MHETTLLTALTPAIILLAAGLAAIMVSRQLRVSPVVGFLLAGVALGPSGFGFIAENDLTKILMELGVVFLLFEIGMHFTTKTFVENRKDMLSLAPLQYFITTTIFTLLAMLLFNMPLAVAILIGGALAISSTAVVARVLVDRNQGTCPVGRSAINVLVFQDIFAVFLLVYGASLMEATGGAQLAADLGVAALKTAIGFAFALTLGPFLLQPAFTALARTRNQEAFTAMALLLALALAAFAYSQDLTPTLGGFLAGMMIGATQYRHVIESEAKPFRGLFLSFFFISIGMMINLNVVAQSLPALLAITGLLIGVKIFGAFAAARLSGWSVPGSAQISTLLAQGSEFTFIILALIAESASLAGTLPQGASSVLIAAVAISLALTPAISFLGNRLARSLVQRREAAANAAPAAAVTAEAAPILLYGMGEVGRRAADALMAHNVPFTAIEADPERFMSAMADGYQVVFGDPGDLRMMDTIGATQARAVALSIPRYEISRDVTPMVQQSFPQLARFVAVADADDEARHAALGMQAVQNASTPPGLDFAARLLRFAGVSDKKIDVWMRAEQARALADPDTPEVIDAEGAGAREPEKV